METVTHEFSGYRNETYPKSKFFSIEQTSNFKNEEIYFTRSLNR
jgi:hypothetical protein